MRHVRHVRFGAIVMGGCILALSAGMTPTAWSYDPTQSTGTGTVQGEDASISTKQGGNTGPTTGRNEHSGSATGESRDPGRAEPSHDASHGSSQLGSDSSRESSRSEGQGKSGTRSKK